MRPRDHRLRLGLVTGMLGSALLLGACTREPGATVTPTGARASASPSRAGTPSPSRSAAPSVAAPSAPTSAAPPPAPPASSPPASAAPTTSRKYVVAPGDTLSAIAEKFGVTTQQLIEANKLSNPDFLTVGQELIIPAR